LRSAIPRGPTTPSMRGIAGRVQQIPDFRKRKLVHAAVLDDLIGDPGRKEDEGGPPYFPPYALAVALEPGLEVAAILEALPEALQGDAAHDREGS
jgi:hypothetical protein